MTNSSPKKGYTTRDVSICTKPKYNIQNITNIIQYLVNQIYTTILLSRRTQISNWVSKSQPYSMLTFCSTSNSSPKYFARQLSTRVSYEIFKAGQRCAISHSSAIVRSFSFLSSKTSRP